MRARRWSRVNSRCGRDEAGWRIQPRCTICPDALGEAADITAADVWPGGNPTGEAAEVNGVITRTLAGEALFNEAMAAGALVSGGAMTPEALSDTQPHHVSKKKNLAARLRGRCAADTPVYAHTEPRIVTLDAKNPAEQEGAFTRAKVGWFCEALPE
ncbi:MAG: Coenzyme F420 hydrogenase/dehydrogenase, beta subunit C-terminal domain [Pseudomonadota bacterium]